MDVGVTATAPDDADIVLVGCSGSKAAGPARAAELFTGAAFRKARDLAVRSAKPWYVLSAKFGLLHADELIAPYDVYLPKQSARYRGAWADWVVAQLGERHVFHGLTVEAHAGSAYCEPLVRPLTEAGATLTQPLAGLGLGRRLAWYGGSTGGADEPVGDAIEVPDVAHLLDQRSAVPPSEFLAAGRSASDRPGLYTWWADTQGADDLSAGLGHRVAPGLVYAGRVGGIRRQRRQLDQHPLGPGGHEAPGRQPRVLDLPPDAGRLPIPAPRAADRGIRPHDVDAHAPAGGRAGATAGAGDGRGALLLQLSGAPLNLRDVPRTPLRTTLSALRSSVRDR
ncbi:conserved protein of unknown function [Blastococcus saxobsidens DD2]|uniref:DUF6884 domain-containing protein n=1 Tax=Blastococcus saxobsidens (strain DD2) TaxID=1146883 RepID=H6RT46_BLASD|nr:conserved protein of unknown function [Blastococcus saxobsidens DD2]